MGRMRGAGMMFRKTFGIGDPPINQRASAVAVFKDTLEAWNC